jgi:hypothetical protein
MARDTMTLTRKQVAAEELADWVWLELGLDTADVPAALRFWSAVLGYDVDDDIAWNPGPIGRTVLP